MAEELNGRGAGIGADVILEFDKSIKNIQAFGDQMTLLDSKFGSLDQRIDAMKNSLSTLSAQTSKATGSNLRKSIEAELNNLVAANGVVLGSIGTAPLKVKQDTVRHLFARVDAELNRAIQRQIGAINVQIDPNYNAGVIPIGKSEFDELNKEIARLVRTQVRHLVDSVRKNGGSMISESTLAGVGMDIGKGTVKQILLGIKEQLKPILLNPQVNAEGMALTISQKDLSQMMNKVKAKLKESLTFDFDGTIKKGDGINEEIHKTALRIDRLFENYIKSIRNGISTINPRSVEIPMQDLSKRLRQYIAKDMKVSEQQLAATLGTIDTGSAHGYELKRQFSSLERTINSKLSAGTSKLITDLRRSVREVEFEPHSTMKHYLIHEINKLNNEIVRKVREQIDKQFQHMRAEVGSVNTAPRDINRNGRLGNMGAGGGNYRGNTTNIVNNYGTKNNVPSRGSNAHLDPYARRDAHFNGFGLEGAVVNTLRHIVAGGMIGMPLMAAYKAMETFKTSQLEQLKIFQNYMMKDDYQIKDEQGNDTPDFAKVEQEVAELVPYIKQSAGFYAIEYGEMSKVAGVASRLTEDKDEARAFMDAASMIYRLDNEGDIVNTIAPGIEAIIGQFELSVWHMDDIVKSFGVATNITKATTDELMKALMRSGSTFHASNITPEQAVMMTASALQSTGLAGEDIGNMFKTFNMRLGMKSVTNKLSEYGVEVYEEDEYGRNMRRNGLDIYTEISNLLAANKIGDQAMDEIFQVTAGGFQYGKVRAFMESLNGMGLENEVGLNVHDMIEKAQSYQMESIYEMLSKSMNSNIMNMERAGVEFDVALASVVESLAPAISELSKVMVNLSQGVGRNSDTIADLIGVIGNTILGAAMWYGGKKVMNQNGFQEHYSNVQLQDRLWGGKGLSGREHVGNITDMKDLMDGRSSYLHGNTPRNREFINAAMAGGTLAPYLQELSEMDSKRKEEIRKYVSDTRGKGSGATDLADFFSIMDESRGYGGRERMTAEKMHQNSAFNARQLANNKALATVMSQTFSQSLVDTMSDKRQFLNFNSQSQNRSFTRDWSRMDNVGRGEFANFLSTNYASVGKTINDMESLQNAFREFGLEQQRVRSEVRNSSPHITGMRDVIVDLERNMDKASRTGGRFANFIDDIGRRGRATLPTLLSMGRTIGGFAAQMALMYAVGDAVSTVASNAALTVDQRKLRDKQTEIDTVNEYGQMQQMKAEGDWMGYIGKSFQTGFVNTIRDFLPGNNHVSLSDLFKRNSDMGSWMEETYGTRNITQVLNQENAKLGADDEPMTIDDVLSRYKKDSGLYEEFADMEYENFKKEYQDMTVAQGKKDDMRREFDKMKEASDLEKWLKGDDIELPISDTIETMKKQLEDLRLDNAWENVNALLSGVKSNSVEFLELRKKQLREEMAVYEQQMELSKKNIEMYRAQLEEIEFLGGKEVWDEEKNRYVKSEEYKDVERKMNKEELRKEEVEKEFGEQQANMVLEERRLDFQIAKKPTDDRLEDSGYDRQMADLRTALGEVENSREFYNDKLSNAQSELASMQEALAEYQSIDPSLDVDGELKNIIKNLEKSILDQTVELKNLRLSRILSYREDLDEFRDNQSIDSLRQRISLGGVDDGDPAMRHFRIGQLSKERAQLERHIAELRAATQDPNATTDEVSKIQSEIRELTKQSLQAQLGIYQELKNTGGSFNLPDGVQVMSQYDYMAGKGTHSNMTIQSGNTYVNITLPNLTDKSGSKAFADAGYQIGQGIAQGSQNSYRNQLNASPWNYPTF